MSEYPEALLEKVAKAIYADERETIDPGWPTWDGISAESRKGVMETASAALDALGLREETVSGLETNAGYDTTPWVRYVTDWETRD